MKRKKRNCALCDKVIAEKDTFLEELTIQGIKTERYVCSECKKKEEKKNSQKIKYPKKKFLYGILGLLASGFLASFLYIIAAVIFKEYNLFFSLGYSFIIFWGISKLTDYTLTKGLRFLTVFVSVLLYILAVDISDFIFMFNYYQIPFIDIPTYIILNARELLPIFFWHNPKYILSQWYHILSIIIISAQILHYTRFSVLKPPTAKYKKLSPGNKEKEN